MPQYQCRSLWLRLSAAKGERTINGKKIFAQCPSNQQKQQQQYQPCAELEKYDQHLWYQGLVHIYSLYLFPKKLPLILIHNTILDTVEMLATNDVFVTLLRFLFLFIAPAVSLYWLHYIAIWMLFVASISGYRNYIGHNDSALHQYWFYCFIVLFP